MPKYLLSHRRSGRLSDEEYKRAQEAVDQALHILGERARVVRDLTRDDPRSRRIIEIEIEEDDLKAKRGEFSEHVIVQPETRYEFHGTNPNTAPGTSADCETPISVHVTGTGSPLAGTEVGIVVVSAGGIQKGPTQVTDNAGQATVCHTASGGTAFVFAVPPSDFWHTFTPLAASPVNIDCSVLPNGPLGWWHDAAGVTHFDADSGHNVRIGLVGSGVGPHPNLSHVVKVDGKPDLIPHETHVAGIIAARPSQPDQFGGIAAGSDVFSIRICEPTGQSKCQIVSEAAIVHAIETLADSSNEWQVDLLNLSFGSPNASPLIHDSIVFALEQGTLCICSAGNGNGKPVDFPAAFPEAVAVSALGKLNSAPPNAISSAWIPQDTTHHGSGGEFLATFSNFGPELFCCAPGTAIISTVPSRPGHAAPYAAMDGTSLASPVACAVLASILSGNKQFQMAARPDRPAIARSVLEGLCQSVGMADSLEGNGLPRLP